jgi:hypothetical protein
MKTYKLNVMGRAWGGFDGETEYTLTHDQAKALVQSKNPKPFCGDFESIACWTLQEVETVKFRRVMAHG